MAAGPFDRFPLCRLGRALTSTTISYHPLLSATIRYYPLVSTSIHYYPLLRHGTSMLKGWELGSVPARLISTLQNGVERVSGLLLINSEWFD